MLRLRYFNIDVGGWLKLIWSAKRLFKKGIFAKAFSISLQIILVMRKTISYLNLKVLLQRHVCIFKSIT